MKRVSCIAAMAVLGGMVSAQAADMPIKAVKAPAAQVYDWTGFYIGATAGAAWTTADLGLNPVNGPNLNYRPEDIPGVIALGTQRLSGTHAIYGGRFGYNQQFGGWVAGLEVDFSSFHFGNTSGASGNPFSFGGFSNGSMVLATNVSTSWLATVRPRLGYAFDRVLVYGTGGAAFGKVGFPKPMLSSLSTAPDLATKPAPQAG